MASFLDFDITVHLAQGGSVRLSTSSLCFEPTADEWHLYGEILSVFSSFAFRKAAEIGPGIDENLAEFLAETGASLPSAEAPPEADRPKVWNVETQQYEAQS